MGDEFYIIEVAVVRMNLLNLFSSYLFLTSNKGVEAEDAPPINFFLFSENFVEQEAAFNSVFGEGLEEPGSLANNVEKSVSLIIGICP